jgi:type I restriction-modification system DNA methylase subunit
MSRAAEPIKTRPLRRLTQAELDAFLEKAADLLRGGVDHSEFRGYVFALLFYKRINDVCNQSCEALLPKEGISSDYLYYLLVFLRPILERFGAGTTFSSVTFRARQADQQSLHD